MSHSLLPTLHLNADSPYFHTGDIPEIVHLKDPALSIILDYKKVRAITIRPEASISDAGIEMKACGVHLLLVVDDEGRVVGLISSEDILGEKPVKISQEKYVSRAELKVRSIMTPQDKIAVIDYEVLKLAKVVQVIQTLKAAKQHYALVVEVHPTTHAQTVRGLLSLSQISKQLAINVIDDDPLARSLIELRNEIRN